jgi:hypothetical protein
MCSFAFLSTDHFGLGFFSLTMPVEDALEYQPEQKNVVLAS